MSEPKRTGLLQLLRESSGCQFVIPVYQRNYTWSADKEVKQYLDDLESVLKGDYSNHFMGIIIYLEKTIDFSSREFSIIDGQQRLTTTFLIIYAVKQLLEHNDDKEKVAQSEGQYLTNPYHADKIKYKLKPLVSDDDVYQCIVENRMQDIVDKRTHDLIKRICKLYPYPEVDIAKTNEDGIIDESTALFICIETAFDGKLMTCLKKNRVYMSLDGKSGYAITSSKMYLQGDKEKYWFGYREARFDDIRNCENKYMLLICRSRSVLVVRFPIDFIMGVLNRLNTSLDDNGNITHYHIILFRNPNGQVAMLLSKPILNEIDVSEYVIV